MWPSSASKSVRHRDRSRASAPATESTHTGNEADQYGLNGLRPDNWSVQVYVPGWEGIAGAVIEAAGIAGKDTPVTLQGAALVSHDTFTPRSGY